MDVPTSASTDKKWRTVLPWPLFASLSGYAVRNLPQDLIAGVTLAAIAIPEQMATARLGGFPAEIGFLAFAAAAIAFALFGASRFMSVGADSTVTPIFAGGLVVLAAAGTQEYAGMAAALAFMIGMILTVAGLCRLGWVADIVSVPVTTGFLAGISVHIMASQLPGLLGLPAPGGTLLHDVTILSMELGRTNLYSVALGLGVLGLVVVSERISARIPGALIGLLGSTAAVFLFGLERRGVDVLGAVAGEVPHLSMPVVGYNMLLHIVPLALIVSVVIILQTAITTRSFVSDPGVEPAVDRDLIGVGAGNILAGLFGAFPVNASPPRTAIVFETGGRSQLAGLAAAALVLGLAAFGARFLAHVPHAALAGILLFVALRIFRVPLMIEIYRRTTQEFALIVITMLAIVLLPIESGVGVGIVLSLIHGIWTVTRARAIELEEVPGTSIWWAPSAKLKGVTNPSIAVVAFQAPLSFLNAYGFKQGVLDVIARHAHPPQLIVLEASSIITIDFTAAQILTELIRHSQSAGIVFAVARLESTRAQNAFVSFGIMDVVGEDHVFHSVDQAIKALSAKA